MITHVALQLADGTVYALPRPARHGNLFREYNDDPKVVAFVKERGLVNFEGRGLVKAGRLDADQGFLADEAPLEIHAAPGAVRFLTREEAALHAYAAGQIASLRDGLQLFSEDVW